MPANYENNSVQVSPMIQGFQDPQTVISQIMEAAEFIKSQCSQTPIFAVICGSGLSNLGNRMKGPIEIPYSNIPYFPKSTVLGHGNKLLIGSLNGVMTACLVGRFHYYEGHDLKAVTFPVRVLKALGVTNLLVTNAAGGIDSELQVGDVMVIKDHISFPQLSGFHALRGPNCEELGPRFPSLTHVYHQKSFEWIKEAALRSNLLPQSCLKQGVYAAVSGPSYETRAELRFLKIVGAHAVGMSTVPEVTVAAHCGIEKIVAFSLITNECISSEDDHRPGPNHEEVLLTSATRAAQLEALVEELAGLIVQ